MFSFTFSERFLLLLIVWWPSALQAADTLVTAQDAAYQRPFVLDSKVSLGGYVEGNTNFFVTDGTTDGFSMELRRFNVFVYSKIHPKLRFLSEVEFEHAQEINLETAQLDFTFHPAFNFRAGILLPQIGLVNGNHDSPKWEFIERPLSSTEIIPTTLSETGCGFFGRFFHNDFVFSYDAYIVNGLGNGIILNESGRTRLADGKSKKMLSEDNNGQPMFNAKVAVADRKRGEVAISWYGGVYNTYRVEGVDVSEKRNLSVWAFDFTWQPGNLRLMGEVVSAHVDVPGDISEIYGSRQAGGFLEIKYPFLVARTAGFEKTEWSVNLRGEYVDYNMGHFHFDGSAIGDEVAGVSIGLSLRPASGTVLRANYLYRKSYDALGNPPALTGGIQVGFATYF